MTYLVWALLLAADPVEHFETKVRPVLAKNCYGCHAKTAMAGLRLDSGEALQKGGRSGPAVVPGQPEASLLWQVVAHRHEKWKMPPTGPLAPAEVEAIAEWVRQGAVFPEGKAAAPGRWWSFLPLRPVTPPALPNAKTEIDRFVLDRLRREGLAPAPLADRRTLLRRASYGLTGLPPTLAELQAFERDGNWEKVIDRLLASPHYGERWGRYWLDVARYADDKLNSTQDEPYPNSWRYRNWVIEALNQDMPYHQFVKAQIAGDQLGPQYAAGTGFFALSPEMQDERVDALTRGFLGLTVACAQCHDHKFDPIPTQDFYSLQGIFLNTQLHETPLAPPAAVEAWQRQEADLKVVEKRLKDFYDTQSRLAGEMLASQTARYLMATQGYGDKAALDAETLTRWSKYVASERLYHPFLDDFRALVKARAPEAQLLAAARHFETQVLAIHEEKKLVDEKNKVLLGVDPSRNDLSQTQLVAMDRDKTVLWRDLFERSISDSGGSFRYGTGVMYYGKGTIERFLDGPWRRYLDEQTALEKAKRNALPPKYPFLQTLRDKDKCDDMKVYIRGDRNNPGELAPRRFLQALTEGERPLFTRGSGRLELAEAIASPTNPLTARVIVNRVWQHHFGRGLVATPSNFGQLGEKPTHPELLDWLAADFMAHGWSLKRLHKQILLSATWQRSAATVSSNMTKDPDNRLLWRANRRRVDAETLRDTLLWASGELDATPGEKALPLDAPDNRKRTVYGFISRRKVDGTLALFDFPNPQATSEGRMSTLVPPQRLYLMNSPFVASRAQALAARLTGATADRIRQAYQLLYTRDPSPAELALAGDFLKEGTWEQYARVLLGSNEFLFIN